jgi:hypothetical protein
MEGAVGIGAIGRLAVERDGPRKRLGAGALSMVPQNRRPSWLLIE